MREGVGVGTGTGVCWIPLCPLTATPGVPFVNPAWPPTAAVGWRGVWSEMVTVFHGARVGMVFFLGCCTKVLAEHSEAASHLTPAGKHNANVSLRHDSWHRTAVMAVDGLAQSVWAWTAGLLSARRENQGPSRW